MQFQNVFLKSTKQCHHVFHCNPVNGFMGINPRPCDDIFLGKLKFVTFDEIYFNDKMQEEKRIEILSKLDHLEMHIARLRFVFWTTHHRTLSFGIFNFGV